MSNVIGWTFIAASALSLIVSENVIHAFLWMIMSKLMFIGSDVRDILDKIKP